MPKRDRRRPSKKKPDRLSALPDDVLHRIMRFMETRDAVADLSLLSRRWRHLWASSPHVVLTGDSRRGGCDSEDFVNSLLLLRDAAAPLHTFCLDTMEGNGGYAHQSRWVRHALGRGLRVLEINLSCCNVRFGLPDDGVFNCATLEEIRLFLAEDVIAPKSICLPRLKKLHLDRVKLIDPSVAEKLSSGCPALEDLRLSHCSLASLFKISSETVKTLSVTGCRHEGIHVSAPNTCFLQLIIEGKVRITAMPSLLSAFVYVCPDGGKHLSQGGYDLVAALCNAQQLELLGFGSILQDMMENSANEGLVFSNLKSLVIGERLVTDFYDAFAYFVRVAPYLTSLTLDQRTLDRWKWDERRRYQNLFTSQVSMEKKPSGQRKLVSGLVRDLEVLHIRLSKNEDKREFRKMRDLLVEKTKPKEMAVKWF